MNRLLSILAGGALLTGAVAVAQAPAQTEFDAQNDASPDDIDVARGAKAWADHCGRCHNLRSPSELNAENWDVSVMHMRARANLPGDLADDIKAFLMSSAQSRASGQSAEIASSPAGPSQATRSFAHLKPGDGVNGREVYAQTCIACHGADGKGTIEGVPDFTMRGGRLSKADGVLLANIIDGFQSEGSLMAMPPRGGNADLTDQDLADSLAYIRTSFGQPPKDREPK